MSWKVIHRWLGLTVGTLAVVLGITGSVLAIDPVQQAWQAPAAPGDLPVATLVERVTRTVPGAEEIRHLPSGAIVVFSFAGDQPQAQYVDPADGRVLGAWQASALPRWVKNLHRSLLLGDAGRWGAAGIALAMALLCVSALVLLLRRMGGWRQLAARVRGSLAQRIHVVAGRVVLAVLCLTSLTALDHERLDPGPRGTRLPGRAGSALGAHRPARLAGARLAPLQSLAVQDLRKLNFPGTTDPEDTWNVTTGPGAGLDRPVLGPDAGLAGRHPGAAHLRPGRGAAHGRSGLALGVGAWARGRQRAAVLAVWRCHLVAGAQPGATHHRQHPAGAGRRAPSSWPAKAAAHGVLPRRCKTR
ncbi:MAG: PepSY-associated TM helix domain-containing protein [Burkholderiaceae bacterium]